MGFTEITSLDADVVVALGKTDKKTGKKYPTQAEGYYLGSRTVQNKRGESSIHFLQTANGNLGVWGTTDLNRKLGQVVLGTMTKITSTGTKPTPNGDMYTYKVAVDKDNTIEVTAAEPTIGNVLSDSSDVVSDDEDDTVISDDTDGDDEDVQQAAALAAAERKAKVEAMLKNGKRKTA